MGHNCYTNSLLMNSTIPFFLPSFLNLTGASSNVATAPTFASACAYHDHNVWHCYHDR